jgi:hypothetical protein
MEEDKRRKKKKRSFSDMLFMNWGVKYASFKRRN